MSADTFKIKTLMILSFLLIWAVVAAAHVFSYAVYRQDDLLKASRAIAWREARIPAVRGRLLDREGVPLAVSSIRSDLVLETFPEKAGRRDALARLLREVFPDRAADWEKESFPLVLRKNISPEEVVLYSRRFRRFPELRVVSRLERIVHGSPEVRRRVGAAALNNVNELVGVSGLEREHDLALSGKAGTLVVMLDRNGSWLYNTLRITKQPENGRDVRTDISLKELGEDHEK
ncbi:MAG: Penicillin-binding Protein dimerization domain protein [Lentisphaerae bacterium ADurb.Bin242]|nr:MAG: Penicillin-binding Protein dimerization domain protein [Lentisphaerae bacterium ADurb.Bin242]